MQHLTLALLLVLGALPAGAATLAERLEEAARPLIEDGWMNGAVVGVLEDGKTDVYSFGHTKPGGPAPDGDTLYEIGSVTKTMTAILLAQLSQGGDHALEASVASLLPGAVLPAYEGREITVLDLLTHHSGLPTAPKELANQPGTAYHDYGPDKLLASLAEYKLERAPGTQYEYSNWAFATAGHLLSERTGTPYRRLLATQLFAPLEMKNSAVELDADQLPRLAPPFDADGNPAHSWEPLVYDAAGAVRSSARDMLHYVQAQIEPPATPLGRAIEATAVPRRPTDDPDERVGLGWHVDPATGTVWHNGQTDGYHSYVAFRRAERTGVVMLTNSSSFYTERLGRAVLPFLAGEQHALSPLPPDLPLAAAGAYTGRYRFEDGFIVEVRSEDAHARISFDGGQRFLTLRNRGDDKFYLRVAPIRFTFHREAGQVTSFTLHADKDYVAKRISDTAAD